MVNHQPRVTIVDEQSHDWQRSILYSRLFACYVSARALTLPVFWEQVAYATRLGKPVRAFVEEGVTLPAGFLDGIADCAVFVVQSPEEMAQVLIQLAKTPE